jgi:CHASE3 domain sensor protein
MTEKEEIALRELAAGKCTIQKVVDAIGPLSLWSKDGLDREIRKAVEVEREACAKIVESNADACMPDSLAQMYLYSNATAIRARGQA